MKNSLRLLAATLATFHCAFAAEIPFYIGTYTDANGSKGIYRGVLDSEAGTAKVTGLAGEIPNPSFLAIHPKGKLLYAAVENQGGQVAAFAIQPDGALRLLNTESSRGNGNCHVWVDASGKNVLAANYGDGVVSCLPIREDGTLAPASSVIRQKGSGPNKERQEGPHAHAIYNLGDFVYTCDLGTDDVFVYRFDAQTGKLTPHSPASARVPAGGGPRHLAFHPDGTMAFSNNELTSAVTAFRLDSARGTLSPVHTVSTLPEGYAGAAANSTAEIHCHPNGRFVYVSNRGHDSLAVFSIAQDGHLSRVEIADAKVKVPRGFAISPDGKWLIAAGHFSNDLALHSIDAQTGKLTFKSFVGKVSKPVNVEFLK
ncbi:MAG: hypothetical protein RLZZ244_1702 [Verrucomicrobiota bacterium]|jgi:6-phosphogluconolactonase